MKTNLLDNSLDNFIKHSKNPHKRQKPHPGPKTRDPRPFPKKIRKPDTKHAQSPRPPKETRRPHPKNEEKAVIVFNLPHSIKMEELQTLFKQFGRIDKINSYWIPKLNKSFNAKVFYKTDEECQKALEFFQDAELDGNILQAKLN